MSHDGSGEPVAQGGETVEGIQIRGLAEQLVAEAAATRVLEEHLAEQRSRRDAQIVIAVGSGWTRRAIAEAAGLTESAIAKVIDREEQRLGLPRGTIRRGSGDR